MLLLYALKVSTFFSASRTPNGTTRREAQKLFVFTKKFTTLISCLDSKSQWLAFQKLFRNGLKEMKGCVIVSANFALNRIGFLFIHEPNENSVNQARNMDQRNAQ